MDLDQVDRRLARWMQRRGNDLLRCGLGLVFVWFGAPKLVPGLSPAEELVARTVSFCDPTWFVPALGLAEVLIGLCLLSRRWVRLGLLLMAGHMVGTALPLLTLPEVAWKAFPIATLEGQYILKNVVLVAAAIVLGGATWKPRARRIRCRRPAPAFQARARRRSPRSRPTCYASRRSPW